MDMKAYRVPVSLSGEWKVLEESGYFGHIIPVCRREEERNERNKDHGKAEAWHVRIRSRLDWKTTLSLLVDNALLRTLYMESGICSRTLEVEYFYFQKVYKFSNIASDYLSTKISLFVNKLVINRFGNNLTNRFVIGNSN